MNMSSDYFSSTKAVPSSDPPTMTRTAQEAMKAVLGTRAVHRHTCSLRQSSSLVLAVQNLTGDIDRFLSHM